MIQCHRCRMASVLAIFIALFLAGQVQAQSLSQKTITLRLNGETLDQALQKLAQRSGNDFTYNPDNLPSGGINQVFKKKKPAYILDQLLHRRQLDWRDQDGLIIIFPAPTPPSSVNNPGKTKSYTLSGYIEDISSGERLIGATLYDARSKRGVLSNAYGFFSLKLPADSVFLFASYTGFAKQIRRIRLDQDQKLVISLKPDLELETVEIIAQEEANAVEQNSISSIRLPVSQIKKLPAILGEPDVLKTIQLLPGVQSSGETNVGIVVRGGEPDQNLFLLDGVPVYNVNHFFGLFSVFNPDAIKSVDLIKGGFPARYGGRLSSVVDIRMREGNRKEFKGNASIGLLSAKCTIEGPIKKDKSSFLVSARRTWIDLITRPITALLFSSPGESGTFGYQFYDLNAKVNQQIGKKDRLFLSFYTGRDGLTNKNNFEAGEFRNDYRFRLGWGNLTSALRWNREISPRLFSNLTATVSNFNFKIDALTQLTDTNGVRLKNQLEAQSGIRDYNVKADFDFYAAPRHMMRFGAGIIAHTFTPEKASITVSTDAQDSVSFIKDGFRIKALEGMLWWEDEWKVSKRLRINPGMHASLFRVRNSNYYSVQPRVSLNYALPGQVNLKASYARMAQYVHLLSNSGVGLPTDLWVPVTDSIRPLLSQQFALGFNRWFPKLGIEVSIEGYYKEMEGLIDYRSGASLLNPVYWENQVEKDGRGWSYGIDFFAQKKTGRLNGWFGYAWNRSWRQFDEINQGQKYSYRHERKHQITIAGVYDVKEGLELSFSWQFTSGNPVTFPQGIYFGPSQGPDGLGFGLGLPMERGSQLLIDYGERNNYRLPPFHRLDLGVRLPKKTKWGEKAWAFGLYNAYSRRNPFFVYLRYEGAERGSGNPIVKARIVSLLPVIPYASFNFTF